MKRRHHARPETENPLNLADSPFRKLLREFMLSFWQLPGGKDVLGENLPERRQQSLHSAAAERGTTEVLLEPFLIQAGTIPAINTRPFI